ncbi:MAG TPA: ketoacyl-ACP synthase III [Nitrospirae bacterium]|nr:ketoacyl-ACP synthase III [Nitrospirota bacterium]
MNGSESIRLRAIASCQPDLVVSSEEIAPAAGLDADFIKNKIGVESRAFLRSDETVTDLASVACEKIFSLWPECKRDEIEAMVLVTQNPDYRLPHTAALVQNRLGLSTSCATFDINLGCSGWVYGLSVIKGFMMAEGMRNGLLVTCDPYSKIVRRDDRSTAALFGDAATATWMSAERGATIGRLDQGTDGSGADKLIVRNGGSVNPSGGWWSDMNVETQGRRADLEMDGGAIFNFMINRVPQSIKNCLDRNGLSFDDIDYFIFHQASRFLLDTLRKRLKLSEEKCPVYLKDVGNTVSSTIPMTLQRLMDSDSLEGKTVLISGFGVGLSWGANILFFGGGKND